MNTCSGGRGPFLPAADVQCWRSHRDARCVTRVVRCGEFSFQETFHCGRQSLRARADALPSMEYLDTNSNAGVPRPRYVTQHTLACLTPQEAEALAKIMKAGGLAHAERVLVN